MRWLFQAALSCEVSTLSQDNKWCGRRFYFSPSVLLVWGGSRRPSPLALRFAGHWDETDGEHALFFDLVAVFAQEDQFIAQAGAHGNDHASSVAELLDEGGRDVVRGAGDDNGVERRPAPPAPIRLGRDKVPVADHGSLHGLGHGGDDVSVGLA